MKFLLTTLAFSVVALISSCDEHCRADDPPEEQPTATAEQKDVFTAFGIVIDSDGNPVPKATIACTTWVNRKRENILLKSDDHGKFEISYPNVDRLSHMLHTWAWAPGHCVRTVTMIEKFKKGTTIAKDVVIELPPNETFDISITDPSGAPFPHASVEVTEAFVPNGPFAADEPTGLIDFVPKAIARRLASITDDEGTVTIEGFPRQLISGVSVSSGTYGTQILPANEEDEFQLVETGSIKGKINAPDVTPYQGMKIYFNTSGEIDGEAIVYVEDDGTFSVPAIPPGRLRIGVAWPSKTDVFPLDTYHGTVRSGQVFEVESASEPAAFIEVSGRVVTEDSGTPLPNAKVSFRDRRGSGPSVRTDEQGEFRALVCEGRGWCQLTSMGTNGEISGRYNPPAPSSIQINVVGDDEKKFKVPDIKVVAKPTIGEQ